MLPERSRWLIGGLALVPFALTRAGSLAESDTFWSVRAGLTTLDTGAVPAADPYSWTVHGAAWQPNAWGFNVLVALAYRAGGHGSVGLAAVGLVATLGILAAGAAVLLLARRLGVPPLPATVVTLLGLPLATDWFQVRAQLVDYIAVPLILVLCDRLVAARRVGPLIALGALHLCWVNLHTAAPLGVVLTGIAVAVPLVRRQGLPWRWAVAAVAVAAAGTAINPAGPAVFVLGAQVRAASADVVEWQALHPTDAAHMPLLLVALAALAVAWRRRDLTMLAVLALLTVGGITAIRLLPVAAVVALPVLASAARLPTPARWLATRTRLLAVGAALVVAAFGATAAASVTHLGQPVYPLATVKALPTGCKLFNSYLAGGPVILFRPDVPVSVDSRNDLYGVDRLRSLTRIERGATDGPAELRAMGVTCVLIPTDAGLADQLRGTATWRETRRTPTLTVFVYAP